ncbi:MAG: MFS transporter [Solobacterium sp.]|nr:MFS transporter [Solobacterium sp.]
MNNTRIHGRYLLILIAMAGMIATSVGLPTNVAGLFFSPIADEFGILKGQVSMTLTICNLVFAAGGMFAPKLLKEEWLRPLLIIGTAVIAGCTALLALSQNIMMMYILNAARGFAAGILGFVCVTMIINNWFVAKVGLATSIAMSCSGVAGALFSPIISSVIESAGWRAGYLVVAVMMVVLNLPAILFVPSLDPKTKGMRALGDTGEQSKTASAASSSTSNVKKISMAFLAMAIVYSFLACGATALPQHFPGIASSYEMAASVGAMMLSVCMAANSIGKIVLGAMADKLGSRISLLIYSALTITAVLLMWLVRIPVSMYAAAILYGLTYSLGTVGVVMITKDMFGLENYSRTYPTISLAGTIANAVFSSLIGFLFDFSGNYTGTLLLMLAMLAVNTVLIFIAYQKKTA